MVSELEYNLLQRVALGDVFRRHARHIPHREAIVENRGNMRISLDYKALNARLNQFAAALKNQDLKKGDKVAIIGPNSWENVVAFYGCAKGGFIAVPLNPRLSPDDVVYMLNHSESKVVVVDDALCSLVDGVKNKCETLKYFVSIPSTGSKIPPYFVDFNQYLDGQSDSEIEEVIWERDTFAVLYTSGTTARPKGIALSHLCFYIMSLANLIELRICRDDSGAVVMPMFHCAQQTLATSLFHIGSKIVIFRSL